MPVISKNIFTFAASFEAGGMSCRKICGGAVPVPSAAPPQYTPVPTSPAGGFHNYLVERNSTRRVSSWMNLPNQIEGSPCGKKH